MPPRTHPLALLASLLFLASLAACFVGYDSRWGQAKAAQQHLAAAATPSAIAASSDRPGGGAAAEHTFRIRFRPNPHYLAQTVNAQEQIEQLVADADGVLRPAIGLHVEIDKVEPWSMNADDKLEPALAALAHDDAAQDVDIVVGLVGALPAPTDDLHLAGCAEVLGKHIVVRAASRLGEHDMVDRALADLSDDEREKLVRARRRHRAEAVFLHELGHVLGALHESQIASLMHPSYDPKAGGYGDDALALMRVALKEDGRPAIAREQLEYLRNAKTGSWSASDREQAEKYLEALAGAAPAGPLRVAAGPGAPVSAASAASAPAGLSSASDLAGPDRDRFDQASRALGSGSVDQAYALAKPLFATYPRSRGVQDLRCQLATVRWLGADELRAECAAYTALLDGGSPGGATGAK